MDHSPGGFMGNQGRWTGVPGGPLRKGDMRNFYLQKCAFIFESNEVLIPFACLFVFFFLFFYFNFFKVPVWRTKGCAELGLTGVILVSTPWERSQDKETSREGNIFALNTSQSSNH